MYTDKQDRGYFVGTGCIGVALVEGLESEVKLKAETGVETVEVNNENTLACYLTELKKHGSIVDYEEGFCCMFNSHMEKGRVTFMRFGDEVHIDTEVGLKVV